MASIFSTYFHENDRRLSAVSRAGSERAREASQPGEATFAKVLADVEKRDLGALKNDTQSSQNRPGSAFEARQGVLGATALTNLNEIEQERIRLQTSAPTQALQSLPATGRSSALVSPPGEAPQAIAAAKLSFTSVTSVKGTPGPVKVTPQDPPALTTSPAGKGNAGALPANRGPFLPQLWWNNFLARQLW